MRFILFISLVIHAMFSSGQSISKLKDDDEVFEFVNQAFNKYLRSANLDSSYYRHYKKTPLDTIIKYYGCSDIVSAWKIKQWEKPDFNNDGFADLFVLINEGVFRPSFNAFVFINIDDTAYKPAPLDLNVTCLAYYPFKIGEQQLLISHKMETLVSFDTSSGNTIGTQLPRQDTLIYKFDHFIEYNTDSICPAIQSVSFSNSSCWIPCPQYKITIDKSKNITLDGYDHSVLRGHYKSIITEKKFREIFDLLKYINPKKLKERYGETGTDGQTLYLEIKFTDGTIKEIKGEGWGGTIALRMIYHCFEEIYKTQNWYK
ncbi:MAG: DUF6438 domain-containing protein [Ferruginibacter sp.]